MPISTEREKRAWWVVNDGRVLQAEGLSCAPDNPDCWWFPTVGYSLCEGHGAFQTREAAVAKALERLRAERAAIDEKIAILSRTGSV